MTRTSRAPSTRARSRARNGAGAALFATLALSGADRALASAPAAALSSTADAERALYEYARALSEKTEKAYAALALEELARYDRLYPDGRFLDDVHYRMAHAEQSRDRPSAAAARYLEVLIVDRDTPREGVAREELDRLLEAKRPLRSLKSRYHEALERYGPAAEATDGARPRPEASPSQEVRLRYLQALFLIDDRDASDVTLAEAGLYLERAPGPPAADEVALAIGDLERRRGQPTRAAAAYERVAFVAPSSVLVTRAMLALGQVLEMDLDDPVAAIAAYQRVARDHPESPEAATAWLRMGLVERSKLKRPEIALRDFDEVLTTYPDHPDAFAAVVAKADTLTTSLKDHARAEAVLTEGALRHPSHARAPELLERAAHIAEHDRKDLAAAAAHLEELASRYPAYPAAAESLLHAAEIHEKDGDTARAIEIYRAVVERFPDTKQASKAEKRLDHARKP